MTGRRAARWCLTAIVTACWLAVTAPGGSVAAQSPLWLIKATDLALYTAHGGTTGFLAASPGSWEAYGPPASAYDGHPSGHPAAVYGNYWGAGGLRHAFATGALPGPYTWVVWDMENWALTSPFEQQHWEHFTALAAALIHSHGMKMIAAPAKDLFGGWENYLSANAAGRSARYADVVSIQSQGVTRYQHFVTRAAAQARASKPAITVLAGLSSCPGGKPQTASQLTAEYNSVFPAVVAGFWLNAGVWLKAAGCSAAAQARAVSGFLTQIT